MNWKEEGEGKHFLILEQFLSLEHLAQVLTLEIETLEVERGRERKHFLILEHSASSNS